jgi:hypothetical protein
MIRVFRAFCHMTGSALTGSILEGYQNARPGIGRGHEYRLNLWLIPRNGWLGAAWSSLLTMAPWR